MRTGYVFYGTLVKEMNSNVGLCRLVIVTVLFFTTAITVHFIEMLLMNVLYLTFEFLLQLSKLTILCSQ